MGVALLIVSVSVMGGFGYQIKQMIVDTQGEVQVRGYGLLNQPDALQEKIAQKLGYRLKGHRLELYGVPIKRDGN